MALHVHRSTHTEVLADALAQRLACALDGKDPFAPVPIVVGSRGMERWLRHWLATRLGIAAQFEFPFPDAALDGALAALAGLAPPALWWATDARRADPWRPEALAWRLVPLLRARDGDPAFAAVARYLGAHSAGEPVTRRELAFAREVADVIDRLAHDRGADWLTWAEAPAAAPARHRWIAALCADLRGALGRGPAERLAAWRACDDRRLAPFDLFGLSTLGPGVRARIERIAAHTDLHLYLAVPSSAWFADLVGARKAARLRGPRAANGDDPGRDNPLLTSLGKASQDVQAWLAGRSGDVERDLDDPPAPPPTALGRLQAWLDDAGPLPAADAPPAWPMDHGAVDPSLAFDAAWGPERQVEVLHERLIALLCDSTAAVAPRDVVVMTPDIATYAPLVAAVFARRGQGRPAERDAPATLPAIPLRIADQGLIRTNPVAEALMAALDLTMARATAPALVELCALDPVRRRFGLEAADLGAVRELVSKSGMRWAFDADDRRAHDLPADAAHTLAFGVERLAIGALVGDGDPRRPDVAGADALTAIESGGRVWAPLEAGSRERTRVVGAITEIVRILSHFRTAFATPMAAADWHRSLVALTDAVAATPQSAHWLRAKVADELAAFAAEATLAGDLPIAAVAVRRHLADRFDIAAGGDRPVHEGVTVCALQPMRSVPFKVIALIGMDDGAFPTGGAPPAWDPFADLRPGERDARTTQRHLILETVRSARQRLWVSWTGFDDRALTRRADAEPEVLPAAGPIEELIDVLGRLSGQKRAEMIHLHPLQPWSKAAYTPRRLAWGEAVVPHDRATARAAEQVGRAHTAPAEVERVEIDVDAPTTLAIDELARVLFQPQREFLRGRLGVQLVRDADPILDREPLSLVALDGWAARDRMLRARLAAADPSAVAPRLVRRMRGEGALPPFACGDAEAARLWDEVDRIVTRAGEVAGPLSEGALLSVRAGGVDLTGAALAEAAGGAVQIWRTVSKQASDRARLTAWLHLIAAVAAGRPAARAVIVHFDGHMGAATSELVAPQPALARAALDDAVAVWRRVRAAPLPLFACTSPAIAAVLARSAAGGADAAAARREVGADRSIAEAWEGERADPWIQALFADFDPAVALSVEGAFDGDAVGALAERIWLPVSSAAPDGGRGGR